MGVSEETATQLREIKRCLKNELEKDAVGNEVRGIYDRVLSRLTTYASQGEDIAIARICGGRYPYSFEERVNNRKRFTPKVIEEIALNELARYILWDLKRKATGPCNLFHSQLKRQLDRYAYDFHNWYLALGKVAEEVSHHWGTPLEAVE